MRGLDRTAAEADDQRDDKEDGMETKRYAEVEVDGTVIGTVHNDAAGRHTADRIIWDRLAKGAGSAVIRPTGRFVQGTTWLDGWRLS